MDLFEEILVLRGALEIEFLNSQSLLPYLDTMYQEISSGNTSFSIIDTLLEKQILTKAQIDFLKEDVEEEKAKKGIVPIDIKNRRKVEVFLGISSASKISETRKILPNNHCSNSINSKKMPAKTDRLNIAQQKKGNAKTARNPKLGKDKIEMFNMDFMPMPEVQNIKDASDLLATTIENTAPNLNNFKTIQLDIRGTSFFKGKAKLEEIQENTLEEIPELNVKLSTIDGLLMVRHALNYDFISTQDLRMLLTEYYEIFSKGEVPDNLAVLLLKKGYITKPQFFQLQNLIEEDIEARKLAVSIDINSRSQVESFIGMLDTKTLLSITCPHCKAKFIARVSMKGGKFRCGKCKETFFLNKH